MKSIEDLNHYELLSVEPWASAGKIRHAYHKGLATYGPESIAAHNLVSEEERARMRQRLDKAYRTLMDPESRTDYDRSIGIAEEEPPSKTDVASEKPTPLMDGPRSFRGADLKRYREAHGISLESISQETKIKISHLQALESEDIESLPGAFFIRGFLKAYASFLKLNPEDVLKGYLGPPQQDAHTL
jgi:DnaJ-class molecular chaperone